MSVQVPEIEIFDLNVSHEGVMIAFVCDGDINTEWLGLFAAKMVGKNLHRPDNWKPKAHEDVTSLADDIGKTYIRCLFSFADGGEPIDTEQKNG